MRTKALAASQNMEAMMNEEVFNVSIRKFLKTLGVSAQREIEKAVRQALAEGKLKGNERLPAKAVVQALASLFTPDEFFASERTIELRRRRRGRARELNSSLAVGDFLWDRTALRGDCMCGKDPAKFESVVKEAEERFGLKRRAVLKHWKLYRKLLKAAE